MWYNNILAWTSADSDMVLVKKMFICDHVICSLMSVQIIMQILFCGNYIILASI